MSTPTPSPIEELVHDLAERLRDLSDVELVRAAAPALFAGVAHLEAAPTHTVKIKVAGPKREPKPKLPPAKAGRRLSSPAPKKKAPKKKVEVEVEAEDESEKNPATERVYRVIIGAPGAVTMTDLRKALGLSRNQIHPHLMRLREGGRAFHNGQPANGSRWAASADMF